MGHATITRSPALFLTESYFTLFENFFWPLSFLTLKLQMFILLNNIHCSMWKKRISQHICVSLTLTDESDIVYDTTGSDIVTYRMQFLGNGKHMYFKCIVTFLIQSAKYSTVRQTNLEDSMVYFTFFVFSTQLFAFTGILSSLRDRRPDLIQNHATYVDMLHKL